MWEKFFTPPDIADFMMSLIEVTSPRSAVDLCAGSWNLLHATKRKWPQICLTGVDTKPVYDCVYSEGEKCFCEDGRRFAIKCANTGTKFSLVVANPPFGYDKNYSEYSFGHNFSNRVLARIEATMLLANLSVVDENGYLAIILPESFLSNISMHPLRCYIGKNYCLSQVVYLPNDIFGDDIKTVLLLIANSKQNENATVSQLCTRASKSIQIINSLTKEQIIQGDWLGIHIKKVNLPYNGEIFRGSVPNNLLSGVGEYPVIHTSDFSSISMNKYGPTRFVKSSILNLTKASQKGDIVISRVGKKCGDFSLIYFNEQFGYSDCVIVLRFDEKFRELILRVMFTASFEQELKKRVKGTCARYLTFNDVITSLSIALGQHIIT